MVNIIMECQALITFNDYFIGVKYNKMSLAYVDAICRKRKEKADLVEYRNRDKKKLHESILQAEDQRKNGKCLTLVREVYGEGTEYGLGKVVGMVGNSLCDFKRINEDF